MSCSVARSHEVLKKVKNFSHLLATTRREANAVCVEASSTDRLAGEKTATTRRVKHYHMSESHNAIWNRLETMKR